MKRIALSFTLAVALAACGTESEEEAPLELASVATAPAGDLTVELLTASRLEVGRTPVYVRVRDASGRIVTDADVTFAPMMAMTSGTSHGAPVIPLPASADGLYRCEVVFQMASGMAGSWSAKVTVTRQGAAPVDATFADLAVVDAGLAKTFAYTDPETSETTRYVMSLSFEKKPAVGLNPIVVTLHRMHDMMTFVPVEDASFVLDPQMPSMGHGSPGNVHPKAVAPGVYAGLLSFSMPGEWETTISVFRDGIAIGAPKFATTF